MFKILKKCSIPIDCLSKSLQIQALDINPRFIRTILDFDGSMTKFAMNLCEGDCKPLINIIEQKQRVLNFNYNNQKFQQVDNLQTLFDLNNIFYSKNNVKNQSKSKEKLLIQRSIKFYITNKNGLNQQKLLYFARSFWNKQKYAQIMEKAHTKPIGLNLIEQQIQIFRKINWTGIVDLQINQSNMSLEPNIYKNLCSRSYSMINNGQSLCELQQFFLPSMFDIFKEK